MSGKHQRQHILEQVHSGRMSAAQGLLALKGEAAIPVQAMTSRTMGSPPLVSIIAADTAFRVWKAIWMIPFWLAVVLTVAGALLIYEAFTAGGVSTWFFLVWLPFLLGLAGMAGMWSIQQGRWLCLRVREGSRQTAFSFSLPMPTGLVAWFICRFRLLFPGVGEKTLTEVLAALDSPGQSGKPFYIHVDEGNTGDQVEIFIA